VNEMRRIVVALVSTVSGLIALFSYRTSTMGASAPASVAAAPAGVVPGDSPSPPALPSTTVPAAGSGGSGSSGSGGSSPSSTATSRVNGSAVSTRWGLVQVQVTVSGGRVVDVTTIALPNGNNRDAVINARAVPVLRAEALAAQSARIDTVSGATVTSRGYISSLQSALDAAHLGS